MIKDFLKIISVKITRWYSKSMEDGKIVKEEWKKLFSELTPDVVVFLAVYFSMTGLGIDWASLGAVLGVIIFELFWYIKEKYGK